MEEQFPVPRNTATSEIGNAVISLLWQLRCHCNPDHNKFSSLSNTTVVSIFPNLCLWRRSLPSNVGGIHSKKLYRATLIFSILLKEKRDWEMMTSLPGKLKNLGPWKKGENFLVFFSTIRWTACLGISCIVKVKLIALGGKNEFLQENINWSSWSK